MTALWPATPVLVAFVLASLLLAVTPGPGVLYIVARTLLNPKTTLFFAAFPSSSTARPPR